MVDRQFVTLFARGAALLLSLYSVFAWSASPDHTRTTGANRNSAASSVLPTSLAAARARLAALVPDLPNFQPRVRRR